MQEPGLVLRSMDALAVAVGFFFSRRLFWAPLIIALIAASLFKKRRPRIW